MAVKSGLGSNFYLDGYDLSGDVTALNEISSPRSLLEVPGIDKSSMTRLLGNTTGVIDMSTWFNDAAGQSLPVLAALPRTDIHMMYTQSTTRGDQAAGLVAKQIDLGWTRATDGSLVGHCRGESNATPLEWGELLTAGKDTHGSAASASSVDYGASTPAGASGYLQVFSLASGSVTLTIEDSSDDSSFSSLKAFTATSGRTKERVTVSGTVDRYARITSSGSFSAAVFAVLIHRGDAAEVEALT